MTLETWLAFFVACWVISLSPGAGAIASMSCGLQYGFWRGYWNAIGLQLALVLQIAVVAAGVGAVLATSELAFGLIKWFGVCYLLWLAWKQWQAQPEALDDSAAPRPIGRPLSLVLRGFLVNASNPKAIVFILAVLPQFLDPQRPLLLQYSACCVRRVSSAWSTAALPPCSPGRRPCWRPFGAPRHERGGSDARMDRRRCLPARSQGSGDQVRPQTQVRGAAGRRAEPGQAGIRLRATDRRAERAGCRGRLSGRACRAR
jgi:homoserine/homoserine lactone efflux protein